MTSYLCSLVQIVDRKVADNIHTLFVVRGSSHQHAIKTGHSPLRLVHARVHCPIVEPVVPQVGLVLFLCALICLSAGSAKKIADVNVLHTPSCLGQSLRQQRSSSPRGSMLTRSLGSILYKDVRLDKLPKRDALPYRGECRIRDVWGCIHLSSYPLSQTVSNKQKNKHTCPYNAICQTWQYHSHLPSCAEAGTSHSG